MKKLFAFRSAEHFIHHFDPQQDVSICVGRTVVKSGTNIRGSRRMIPDVFGDSLAFPPVLLSHFRSSRQNKRQRCSLLRRTFALLYCSMLCCEDAVVQLWLGLGTETTRLVLGKDHFGFRYLVLWLENVSAVVCCLAGVSPRCHATAVSSSSSSR